MPSQDISDRYELVQPLSHGGMGDVWRGYDRVLDRPVAVKLIRQAAIATPAMAEEFTKRFKREARVTARIQHPGVPQVYDAVLDESDEQLYLVMELVDGVPLGDYIDPDQPLPMSWAAAVAAQVCTVLSHAHAVPIVHRDLKPSNILVAEDGTVKVLDFGIAAVLRTDVTRITATGNPVGTSQYMAPEQVQGGRVTPQSDLYALGCILHELCCGRPLFNGVGEYQLMRQHVEAAPVPLRLLRYDVPNALEELVLHLLRKRPERRPADAQEVYERLLPFLPPPGQAAAPDEVGPVGTPDPTGIYRQPYAPRPRAGTQPPNIPATHAEPSAPPVPPAAAARLREDIKVARAQANALLEEERFTQAAEVLSDVVEPAALALGSDNSEVLDLRMDRAAVRFLGGDYRRALPEFDALASAFSRTAGPTSEKARSCHAQAAHCRAELGQVTVALQEFEAVLRQVRAVDSDASDEAIELRRAIGFLELSEGRLVEARRMLEPLHDDMCVVYGPDDEETVEIAEALTRIRLALGGTHRETPET
ncbi:serine/threonine protein kinase [Streptomyces sp. NRRL F-5122]|uniref:serine/threonine-protein kinase n=1 Tax=Streptomyces sp. NRRL F-5122 TaxID=1609098 RepID=UPI0007412AA2|nr:serine/threonine-protein kinase [Streptomyces sp. NRRL F-5122]KUJ38387.1 serine/threonine protein kinase [Streptomyces sp. NRRL F-5122]